LAVNALNTIKCYELCEFISKFLFFFSFLNLWLPAGKKNDSIIRGLALIMKSQHLVRVSFVRENKGEELSGR